MSNTELTKIYTTFHGWFGSAMSQTDMTVQEIANKMRVSTCTVYSWLKGKHKPSGYGQVKEICRLMDANPEFVWMKYYSK